MLAIHWCRTSSESSMRCPSKLGGGYEIWRSPMPAKSMSSGCVLTGMLGLTASFVFRCHRTLPSEKVGILATKRPVHRPLGVEAMIVYHGTGGYCLDEILQNDLAVRSRLYVARRCA